MLPKQGEEVVVDQQENHTHATLPFLNDSLPNLQQLHQRNVTNHIHIAGLYDLTSFPDWPGHLLNFTIRLINNHTDGWHDDVLNGEDGALLHGSIADSGCDSELAVAELLGLRALSDKTNYHHPPYAIFGCRCSGASMAVALICDVANVPMLSPASSSVKLSNKDDYATFSRLVPPDNERGQVGALVKLLRVFNWNRISIINTDTPYTRGIALELSDAWKGKHYVDEDPFVGEVAYTDTIKLNSSNEDQVDETSVRRVLKAVPTDNSDVNSRVIVLFAHHQHAFPILEIARKMNFQPDTIWVGTSEWVGREPLNGDTSWMPDVPGYLGIKPYRNKNSTIYIDYLERLQEYERQNNLTVTEDLYDFVADRFVDGVLALAKAFSAVPHDQRQDGRLVSQKLRELEFEGLSGSVAFDRNGDRRDPRFTVVNLQSNGTFWTPVGTVTPTSNAKVAKTFICWAEAGCVQDYPDDEYPMDRDRVWIWMFVMMMSLIVISVLFFHQRSRNRTVTEKLYKIEKELNSLDSNDDVAKQRRGRLYKEIAGLLGQPTPEHWTEEPGLTVEIEPTQQEYWDILTQLRSTMNEGEECHLSKLRRIQNEGIWSYYVFRKNQLANKYGTDLNDTERLKEKSVWHGTSTLNPDVIYKDQQDGFMMQLSREGHWGRGIYFSERSGYSDPYSYKPLTEHSEDSTQQDRELFLVKLLIGESIFLDRNEGVWMEEACKNLLTPPDNPGRHGLKFDTVEGEVDDEAKTRIYVVYENGRAYPEYLVRYYKGERDEARTPYTSLEEALVAKTLKEQEVDEETVEAEEADEAGGDDAAGDTTNSENENSVHNSVVSVQAVWQFLNDSGDWENYLDAHQNVLEQAYQQDASGVATIELFPWTYAIDFNVNIQTNLDHPNNKTRQVRRICLDSGD